MQLGQLSTIAALASAPSFGNGRLPARACGAATTTRASSNRLVPAPVTNPSWIGHRGAWKGLQAGRAQFLTWRRLPMNTKILRLATRVAGGALAVAIAAAPVR